MTDSVRPDEDRYQILARSTLTERVLKHDETFAVFNRHGDIRSATNAASAEGLYHEGTRFLSRHRLRIDGVGLLLLSSTVREDNVMLVADLMNPDLGQDGEPRLAHGLLHVFRSKFLWRGACYEALNVANYGREAIELQLQLEFAADFLDVFEVRGMRRVKRGTLDPPLYQHGEVVLGYIGLDGVPRRTRIHVSPMPDSFEDGRVQLRLHLAAGENKTVYVTVSCETGHAGLQATPLGFDSAYDEAHAGIQEVAQVQCALQSSNGHFDAWIRRSLADLRMLVSDTRYGRYPYAGVPWFSTPFGRDGIITALSALWLNPEMALGVLRFLAAMQADRHDSVADAEPGKILHELRLGEMAKLGEVPFGKYYGSVDTTPLFVMLMAAYYELTADLLAVAELWPNVLRALDWMREFGDQDRDGFLEYHRKSPQGLTQQGWKDSGDSVFHADGTLAEGPIALCEVQGYAYAAWRGAAKLASALGHHEQARALESRADALRVRFDEAFWCADLGTYALALDGNKRPCRVRTSNAGHCLFTGIALPERAPLLADQLLSAEMFSGWGIRTVASCERRYNPMSYHNGSIWPHDNALIAAGFARYGLTRHAGRVFAALFDVSSAVELHRLPELFCGFPRRDGEGPTLYPVACAPQAWAAAAPFLLLQAVLGLSVDARHMQARFQRAMLPPFLDELQLSRLRVGAATVDLCLHRYPDNVGINVVRRHGPVDVLSVK